MDPTLITPLFTLLGTLVGGLVTFAVNRQQFKHQIQALQQQYKTEFMADTNLPSKDKKSGCGMGKPG